MHVIFDDKNRVFSIFEIAKVFVFLVLGGRSNQVIEAVICSQYVPEAC